MVRRWRDNTAWRAHATLGPLVAARLPLNEGRSTWTAEVAASTPLLGALGRPGFATSFQDGTLSPQDITFATLDRHRGGRVLASLLWRREGRASLRFSAELSGRAIPWRHRLAEVQHVLSTMLYWRL